MKVIYQNAMPRFSNGCSGGNKVVEQLKENRENCFLPPKFLSHLPLVEIFVSLIELFIIRCTHNV